MRLDTIAQLICRVRDNYLDNAPQDSSPLMSSSLPHPLYRFITSMPHNASERLRVRKTAFKTIDEHHLTMCHLKALNWTFMHTFSISVLQHSVFENQLQAVLVPGKNGRRRSDNPAFKDNFRSFDCRNVHQLFFKCRLNVWRLERCKQLSLIPIFLYNIEFP